MAECMTSPPTRQECRVSRMAGISNRLILPEMLKSRSMISDLHSSRLGLSEWNTETEPGKGEEYLAPKLGQSSGTLKKSREKVRIIPSAETGLVE